METKDFENGMIHIDLEAEDTLGVLLKSVRVEFKTKPANAQTALRKQATTIVAGLSYIEELKVIEVDGVSNAVQIRSVKPSEDGFIEIILRGGNQISFERRGTPLHISRKDFSRLL